MRESPHEQESFIVGLTVEKVIRPRNWPLHAQIDRSEPREDRLGTTPGSQPGPKKTTGNETGTSGSRAVNLETLYSCRKEDSMRTKLRMCCARTCCALLCAVALVSCVARDNRLTPDERRSGWILLFDGETLDGWMTSARQPSARPVENGALNPHRCGDYMLVYEETFDNFVLALDFMISESKEKPVKDRTYNSGLFFRVASLEVRPGLDVGYNGIEMAIDYRPDDPSSRGFHDTGAIYDLVRPHRNVMRPPGTWNHVALTCDDNLIVIELNGEEVSRMDLNEWIEPGTRPDGTSHKFDVAYKHHPRSGYIGLQDHGCNIWFKNIKLKPLVDR